MGTETKIGWTDHTFNPWIGCTKVSPGCLYCYAESLNLRWSKGANWGKGMPRRRTSLANWKEPIKWNRRIEKLVTENQVPGLVLEFRRPRVFCASLADWLDDEVPIAWLADLLDLVRSTPFLDWQLLTKRPELWRDRLNRACAFVVGHLPWIGKDAIRLAGLTQWIDDWLLNGVPRANVWIGTSVEDQTRADERIRLLLQIPAKVRFLSCEPLIGPVNVASWGWRNTPENAPRVNWVICGGESGREARTMEEGWARDLLRQCKEGEVPFFMKQLGGRTSHRAELEDLPADLRVREFPT